MVKAVQKITLGIAASLMLVTGFALAPMGSLPSSLGTQKAHAACSDNVYQVVWPSAGLYYTGPGFPQVGTYYAGQRIHGPTGYHRYTYLGGFGWITIVGSQYNLFMRSDALAYIGCS